MVSKIFDTSKLENVSLLEMTCKKLEAPSKKSYLNIQILFDLSLEKIADKNNYSLTMSIKIKCEENGNEKLFSLIHRIRATYSTKDTGKINDDSITKEIQLFLSQLYLLSRDDINNILNKMKVRFQMPFNIPDEIKADIKKKNKAKTKK